jgi:hypothetical protein
MIRDAMEVSKKSINKAIMDNKHARKYYDWIFKELAQINKLEFEKDTSVDKLNYLGKMARNLYKYCKSIHALDHIRWQSQQINYLNKPFKLGFVLGFIKMFNE